MGGVLGGVAGTAANTGVRCGNSATVAVMGASTISALKNPIVIFREVIADTIGEFNPTVKDQFHDTVCSMRVTKLFGSDLVLYFTVFGLVVLPFVFWPTAPVAYEIPRVWFVLLWIEALAAASLVYIMRGGSVGAIQKNLGWLLFGFVGVAIIASLVGVDIVKSIWGNYYRRDGLFTLIHEVGLALIIGRFWTPEWAKPWSMAVIIGAVGTVIWSFSQHPGWGPIGGPFGQPKFLTGYLLVCLPFAAYLMASIQLRIQKFLWAVALFILTVGIVLTQARAGILGIGIFFAGWMWIAIKHWGKYVLSVLLVLCTMAGGWWLFLHYYYHRLPYQLNAESRERIIVKGVLAFTKRPLLGWGWANFDHAFAAVDWPYHFRFDAYVDKAHSMLLEVLTTTGSMGFIVYVTLLFFVGRSLFFAKGLFYRYVFLSYLLYLFHSQTNVLSIAEDVIFWCIVGIASQRNAIIKQ